jgi:hypothetical protein
MLLPVACWAAPGGPCCLGPRAGAWTARGPQFIGAEGGEGLDAAASATHTLSMRALPPLPPAAAAPLLQPGAAAVARCLFPGGMCLEGGAQQSFNRLLLGAAARVQARASAARALPWGAPKHVRSAHNARSACYTA